MKTLAKEHQALTLNRAGPVWTIDSSSTLGSWSAVNDTTFVSSQYIDLAGMSMEEKTLFFEAATVQTVGVPSATNTRVGDSVAVMDLMSSREITNLQAALTMVYGNFAGNVNDGTGQGPLSFNETIYARVRNYVRHVDTASWGLLQLTAENFFGSMEPTASDRIYSYRVVAVSNDVDPTATDRIYVYPARHLVQVKAKQEPDHEYMMRLLRSYQLQQEPDVD